LCIPISGEEKVKHGAFKIFLLVTIVFMLAGCAGTRSGEPSASTLKGVPPFFIYTTGEEGFTLVPPLLCYQARSKESTFTLGLLGLASIGQEKRFYDENDGAYLGMRSWDLNFLGLYSSVEEETVDRRVTRIKFEKLILGGLFGWGQENGINYAKLFWVLKLPNPQVLTQDFECPICRELVGRTEKYCPTCGQKFLPLE
jgi:hypothetical protein